MLKKLKKIVLKHGIVLLFVISAIIIILYDCSHSIRQQLSEYIGALKNVALYLDYSSLDTSSTEETSVYLNEVMKNTEFTIWAVIDANGVGTDNKERMFELSDNVLLYQNALSGKAIISDNSELFSTNESIIPVMIPIISKVECIPDRALMGRLAQTSKFTPELLKENMKVKNGSEQREVKSDMSRGKSGHMILIGNRYIVALIRHDIRPAYASTISIHIASAFCLIIICFMVCMLFILQQQKRHTEVLKRIAFYDELCDCPNLAKFKLDVQQYIDSFPNEKVLVVKFDIREFKLLNSILGQKMGNMVLVQIADVLRQVTRPGCFCRDYNDEFYITLICESPNDLNKIGKSFFEQLYKQMGSHFTYHLKVVAGLYFMSFEKCLNAAEAVEKANIAHSKAKELGVEICIYDEEFVRLALWKKEVESNLPSAIENDEFKMYLQAQYSLKNRTVSSAEALVRWERKESVILPNDFIPILEQNGLIIKLDFYMFKQACKTLREWLDQGINAIEIAVNFSRKHLADPEFVQKLCNIADNYRIPHYLLVVELTETAIWRNEKIMLEMVDQLHKNGFLLAMDDFGTGYSSLGLLKNLPVDILKIDRNFFVDNRFKTRAKFLILNIMNMANQLNMITVAEGVEDQDHIDFLCEAGCDKVQSYFFEKPVPVKSFWSKREFVITPESHIETPLFFPLGDIGKGRGELGEDMPVKIYRLFLFSMREALIQKYGEEEMIEVYRIGGCIAGRRFAKEYLELAQGEELFFEELQQVLHREKIGELKIENKIKNWEQMIVTISNDLDCSGIEDEGKTLCQYDEGFLTGILFEYTKKIYVVNEIDCWGNGAQSCRFLIRANEKR